MVSPQTVLVCQSVEGYWSTVDSSLFSTPGKGEQRSRSLGDERLMTIWNTTRDLGFPVTKDKEFVKLARDVTED